MNYKGYVGTYTSKDSKGIYSFNFDGKSFSDVKLFKEVSNPKYLVMAQDYICAACDFEKGSGIGVFDSNGKVIDTIVYENSTSAHIIYKDEYFYTCNYHEGTFSVVSFKNNKLTLIKKLLIKEKAGSHQVIAYNDEFLVPCLFLDKIIIISNNYEIKGYIELPAGSGPRHAVFSKDKKYLYLVGELSNQLYVIDLSNNKVVNTVNLLKDNRTHLKDTAAIRLSEDGKYLYVSTRTEDVISVLSVKDDTIELLQVESSQGLHPRDFNYVKDYLFVANRNSDNLVALSITDGLIDKVIDTAIVPEGVCVILEENNE